MQALHIYVMMFVRRRSGVKYNAKLAEADTASGPEQIDLHPGCRNEGPDCPLLTPCKITEMEQQHPEMITKYLLHLLMHCYC